MDYWSDSHVTALRFQKCYLNSHGNARGLRKCNARFDVFASQIAAIGPGLGRATAQLKGEKQVREALSAAYTVTLMTCPATPPVEDSVGNGGMACSNCSAPSDWISMAFFNTDISTACWRRALDMSVAMLAIADVSMNSLRGVG